MVSKKKLRTEAMPRYSNINFFELSGKPAKREEYRNEQGLDKCAGKATTKSRKLS